jgi:hypothetical protein
MNMWWGKEALYVADFILKCGRDYLNLLPKRKNRLKYKQIPFIFEKYVISIDKQWRQPILHSFSAMM